MFERRRRILREARKLLVQRGLEGFTFRELCKNADVAQRTIYNAFGGKERVMAMAIRQYYDQFVESIPHAFTAQTLDGVLEQLIYTHVRNGDIKNYTKAVIALYNSPTADPEIREAMRQIGVEGLTPLITMMKAQGKIERGIDIDELIDNLTNVQYMILSGWCLGSIEDSRFVFRMIEAFLLMASSVTKGTARAEIVERLRDLHGPRTWFDAAVANARASLRQAGIRPPLVRDPADPDSPSASDPKMARP